MVMSGVRANVGSMRRFLFLSLSLLTVAAAGLSACTSPDPEVIVVTSTAQPQPGAAESSAAAAASTANGTASAENTEPTDDYEASKAESDRLRAEAEEAGLTWLHPGAFAGGIGSGEYRIRFGMGDCYIADEGATVRCMIGQMDAPLVDGAEGQTPADLVERTEDGTFRYGYAGSDDTMASELGGDNYERVREIKAGTQTDVEGVRVTFKGPGEEPYLSVTAADGHGFEVGQRGELRMK